jgi:type I restriction enzyme S subunit
MENPEGKFPAEFDTYQKVSKGDFVFCLFDVEETPRTVGLSDYDGMITGAYTVLENKIAENRFLYYFYLNLDQNKRLKFLYRGLRNTIPKDSFLAFKTALPPKEEQIQIADFLDKKTAQIDKAITLKEQLIERLKERRQILINDAVTKGLDKTVKMKNSGIEWIGEIPEHWEAKKVRYLFEFSKGLTITKENLRATGIPCVNYGEIHSKYGFEVDPERHELKCVDEVYLETSQKSLLNHGDFIFADTSEDIEGAGNFTYLNSRIPTFAGYHTIIARSKIGMIPRYIAYYFDSLGFRNQIRSRVKGVKVYSITNSILKDALVCLPEMEEQQRISNYLDKQTKKIDTAIELQQKQIEKLKEYRASLIDSVVTGKVKIMEDEYGSHH